MADKPKKAARAVLVTGAPRSGTTPVGELLGGAPGAIELYEPMSYSVGDHAVPDWLSVPGQEGFDLATVDDLVDRILRRRVKNAFRPDRILGRLGRNRFLNRSRRTAMLARLQPWKGPQIWKDPMAFMIAPRVARNTDVPVIITVRDHLSLASSFKRMSWRPPVEGLVSRMQDAGMPIDPRIPELIKSDLDAARAGAIAWNLLYSTLLREMRDGLPATVIRNSDLMERPDEVRERLIAVTGLAVPQPAAAAENGTAGAEPLPEKAHIQNRSLESITQYWKKTLDEEQVAFSRNLNDDLWAELEPEIRRHREAW